MSRGPDRFRAAEGVRGALWRSLAVFRLVAAAYAVATVGLDLGQTPHPGRGLAWFGVLAVWSVVMSWLAPAADGWRPWRRYGLVVADVVVCVAVMLTCGVVSPAGSTDVLPALWTASGVFSAALAGGTAGGAAGGSVLAVASFVASGSVSDSSVRPAVLFVVSGIVVGYLSRTAIRAESALADVLAARAGDAERERLARGVHDSVLQVLSLIAREAERGMAAADVARLAAAQESALRDLLRTPGTSQPVELGRPTGRETGPGRRDAAGRRGAGRGGGSSRPARPEADLEPLLTGLARMSRSTTAVGRVIPPGPALSGMISGPSAEDMPAVVTVSTPGAPVPLPADHADEVVAAVRAALDNVATHAGPGASAWLLLEDDGDSVTVTVRDDGIGIEPGRAEQAAAEGRLGLAVSVCGRIRDLGGDVVVTGRPGQGTEVELRVPR
ncbi:histidine kinase [Parafrankia soli]|uniref:Histidine kinase n=1 Tax=Parafrankia soli TaxID=2599596 RepID=A0A1S1REM4_9ACTN|nr:histidine kinase [Parafrankia soli]